MAKKLSPHSVALAALTSRIAELTALMNYSMEQREPEKVVAGFRKRLARAMAKAARLRRKVRDD